MVCLAAAFLHFIPAYSRRHVRTRPRTPAGPHIPADVYGEMGCTCPAPAMTLDELLTVQECDVKAAIALAVRSKLPILMSGACIAAQALAASSSGPSAMPAPVVPADTPVFEVPRDLLCQLSEADPKNSLNMVRKVVAALLKHKFCSGAERDFKFLFNKNAPNCKANAHNAAVGVLITASALFELTGNLGTGKLARVTAQGEQAEREMRGLQIFAGLRSDPGQVSSYLSFHNQCVEDGVEQPARTNKKSAGATCRTASVVQARTKSDADGLGGFSAPPAESQQDRLHQPLAGGSGDRRHRVRLPHA